MNENLKGLLVTLADFAALLFLCVGLYFLMWLWG